MARPLRIERTGGWYHLTARGHERRAIYRDDRDRGHFLEALGGMVERFRVRLHACVLMDNHYHLPLELTEPNLSRAAQWLNVSYRVWFNRRHGRAGPLLQGRFKSVVVDPAAWGLELSRCVLVRQVEKVKGRTWAEFRDEHGDSGRDLALYVGRRAGGLKLRELAALAGMRDYTAVAVAARRFEQGLAASRPNREQLQRVCQLSNVEM